MKMKPTPWQARLIDKGHVERMRETRLTLEELLSPAGITARVMDAEHRDEARAAAENALSALEQHERLRRNDSFSRRAGLALHDAANRIAAVTNSTGLAWFRGELYVAACRIGEAGAWLAASTETGEAGASGRGGRPADIDTRREIRRRWDRLAEAGREEHERAAIIARELRVTPEAIRRHIRALGLRKAERKGG